MRKMCSVRFDDICPTMNWNQFNKAMDMMEVYHIKPLLGVIPDNEDSEQFFEKPRDEFWKLMRRYQAEGFTIAMHGYKHIYDINCRGMINTGTNSEFAGHTYEEQYKKIKAGKEVLMQHGISTDIFFAPSHSYDVNTLKALRDNGFKYISDGRSRKPYIQEGVLCLPCRSFTVPKKTRSGFNLAVCHSSRWDEYPENVIKLEKYLNSNKNFLVDYKEYFSVKPGAYYLQKIDELTYIVWNERIRKRLASNSILLTIYHKLSR